MISQNLYILNLNLFSKIFQGLTILIEKDYCGFQDQEIDSQVKFEIKFILTIKKFWILWRV